MSTTVVSAARRLIQTQENGIFTKYQGRISSTTSTAHPLYYLRSFHNSRVLSAKDTKKDTRGPQPGRSATPQAVGKPAVVNSENVPRTVIRPQESLADIKANITKLVDEEVEFLNESAGVSSSVSGDLAKDFLAQTKFKLVEKTPEQVFLLTKTADNADISVEFNRFDEEGLGDDLLEDREGKEEEEVDEDAENEEGSMKEDDQFAVKHRLKIEIAFKDNNGNVKGRWYLGGHSGKDNRLYVTDMAVVKGAEPKKTEELVTLPFDAMSDDMQDRLYDYLDEVGIDDQLANFVKAYIVDLEGKAAISMLQDLKFLLK